MERRETMSQRHFYAFTGCVKKFDTVVARKWDAETCAVSEKQARNNIAMQFRRQMGYQDRTPISLEGKITALN